MIKNLYNTNAATAAAMLDVTDDIIHSFSNGEVTHPWEDINAEGKDEDALKGSLTDPEIFGSMPDNFITTDNVLMGHIDLNTPFVNIQYYKGTKPKLDSLTGFSIDDLDRIIYYAAYLVTEDISDDIRFGTILSEKEYSDVCELHGYKEMRTKTRMGAEAVECLLKNKGVADETINRIILHSIPVTPLITRFYKENVQKGEGEGEEVETACFYNDIHKSYARILLRNNRLKNIIDLGAPDILTRNEKRMLQEALDTLINNGARQKALAVAFVPRDSLTELDKCISSTVPTQRFVYKETDYHIDRERFIKAHKDYRDYLNKIMPNDGDSIPYVSPEQEELDRLEDIVRSIAEEYADRFIDEYYKGYSDFKENMKAYSSSTDIADTYSVLSVPDEEEGRDAWSEDEMFFNMEYGMQKMIFFYITKQAKWCNE